MKEEEKIGKKGSKKLIIVIAVIIAIAAIAFGFYRGIFSLPTGLAIGDQTNAATENTAASSTPQQITAIATGKEMISTVSQENLPYYESADLEPGEYVIQVTTDQPVWVNAYRESTFNKWKDEGYYGTAIAGTGSRRAEYQTKAFSESFRISKGGEGKYYIVIEGVGEASINLKLVQTFKY